MHAAETAVKDMEAAAIAYVCRLWGTPMVAVKAVTDIVDGGRPTNEQFLENLHTSSEALQQGVSRILAYMDGKALSEV
jgi:5'-methylthioadenosine nucleosidase